MIPKSKPFRQFSCLLLSLFAVLFLLACRSEITTTSDEASLVWEAWDHITESYVKGDSLDSELAAGSMIVSMLEVSGKPSYPFLTDLEDTRVRPPRDVPKELTDVWKAWVLFQKNWPELSPSLLAEAALDGMLDSLGEDEGAHLTSEAYERAQEQLRGTYQGIGAFVVLEDGKIVLSPMRGSPAEAAGLEAGDVTLEVDGVPVEDRTLQDIVDSVRGPVGTKLKLLVERAAEEEPLEFNVIRGDIDMVSVDRSLFPGAIGYIYIADFQENTPDELLDMLEELQQVDMLALILDLRNNSGGSLESAHQVVSQFLPGGVFMYEIDKNGTRKDWPVEEGGLATEDLPMVVMVNELTGSAAEAVAGALQDTERATVLGTTTAGKGSANVYKKLSDGSAIYFPVSHWYTPTDKLIQGAGIEPDLKVDLTVEDRLRGIDSPLARAYGYLDDLLAKTVPFQ